MEVSSDPDTMMLGEASMNATAFTSSSWPRMRKIDCAAVQVGYQSSSERLSRYNGYTPRNLPAAHAKPQMLPAHWHPADHAHWCLTRGAGGRADLLCFSDPGYEPSDVRKLIRSADLAPLDIIHVHGIVAGAGDDLPPVRAPAQAPDAKGPRLPWTIRNTQV